MNDNEPGQPNPDAAATTRDLPTPRSALAIGAHPDDVEFGCGATLAKWAADGCIIHHLVCTDGSKGTWNPDADTVALAATRQDEQREAARRLAGPSAGTVHFLGYVDGELASGLVQRGQVARIIRSCDLKWCLATTRGSDIGYTPITDMQDCWRAKESLPHATLTSFVNTYSRLTGRITCCCGRRTKSITSKMPPASCTSSWMHWKHTGHSSRAP